MTTTPATMPANQSENEVFADHVSKLSTLYESAFKRLSIAERELEEKKEELGVWKQAHKDSKAQQVELQRKVQDVESTPLIYVALDGDGCLFSRELVELGRRGGTLAAEKISSSVQELVEYLQIRGKPQILVQVFLNQGGLASVMQDRGWCTYEQYSNFVIGFNSAHPLFTMTDCGPGKEAADAKLRAMVTLYASNSQCRLLLFGGTHDNGYASLLASLKTTLGPHLHDRLFLLTSYREVARELQAIGLHQHHIPGLFAEDKIPNHAGMNKLIRMNGHQPSPPHFAAGYTMHAQPGPLTPNGGHHPQALFPAQQILPPGPGMPPRVGSFAGAGHVRGDSGGRIAAGMGFQSPQGGRFIDPSKPLHQQHPPPCIMFYVAQKGCPKGQKCRLGHDYILTPAQHEQLRRDAKGTPCRFLNSAKGCDDGDLCVFGHACRYGASCKYGNNCKFRGPNSHGAGVPFASSSPSKGKHRKAASSQASGSPAENYLDDVQGGTLITRELEDGEDVLFSGAGSKAA